MRVSPNVHCLQLYNVYFLRCFTLLFIFILVLPLLIFKVFLPVSPHFSLLRSIGLQPVFLKHFTSTLNSWIALKQLQKWSLVLSIWVRTDWSACYFSAECWASDQSQSLSLTIYQMRLFSYSCFQTVFMCINADPLQFLHLGPALCGKRRECDPFSIMYHFCKWRRICICIFVSWRRCQGMHVLYCDKIYELWMWRKKVETETQWQH